MKDMYVYILTNFSRTLYIGVTNDLDRRITEHKSKKIPGFTAKYNISKFVYFETYSNPMDAIERGKILKAYRREKKVALIERMNPDWEEISF